MGGTIVEALRIVRGDRQLLALIVFAAALWTVSALVHLYAQAVLAERGLAPSQIGIRSQRDALHDRARRVAVRAAGESAAVPVLDGGGDRSHRGVGAAPGRRPAARSRCWD